MQKVFGYVRISTPKQNIERQIRNILKVYPTATIIQEVYSGKSISRPEFVKLLKLTKAGDTIVFDSVSRFSRNASEGFRLYKELFTRGVKLVFLKEPHINSDTYRHELNKQLSLTVNTGDNSTNELLNTIIEALNRYILSLAEKQIELAFSQAEKEVTDLRQRTREGIETARRAGKQIGGIEGKKLHIKKKSPIQALIRRFSKNFNGTLNDIEVIALIKAKGFSIAHNTYYKYKKELKA